MSSTHTTRNDVIDCAAKSSQIHRSSSRDAWTSFARQRLAVAGGLDAHESKSRSQIARGILEQEVENARRATSDIQHQINCLLPICQLPAELLAHIFQELSDIDPLHTSSPQASPTRTWLVVTHICRTWRSVALECASLWTTIPVSSGELWADAFVTRSKAATLFIPGLEDLSSPPWVRELVHGQISRIGSLGLVNRAHSLTSFFELVETSNPERLFRLALEPCQPSMPGSMLCEALQRAPMLRNISLASVFFPRDALPWSTLRSVKIVFPSPNSHYYSLPDSATTDWAPLLASLASATALEKLCLNSREICFNRTTLSQSSTVHLPRLRLLTFVGYAADFTYLFSKITTPAAAALTLDLHSDGRVKTDDFGLSAVLREHITHRQQQAPGCIQAMRLSQEQGVAKLEAWQTAGTTSTGEMIGKSKILNISLHGSVPSILNTVLRHICNGLALGSLHDLYLPLASRETKYWWSDWTWSYVFSSATNVRRLFLPDPRLDHFFNALCSPTYAVPPGATAKTDMVAAYGERRILFPLLDCIHVDALDEVSQDTYFSDWIVARTAYNPIKTLRISKSHLDGYTIRALREIAGLQLEWDEWCWDGHMERSDPEDSDSSLEW